MAIPDVRGASLYSVTTRPERVLLTTTIIMLPLEAHIPPVGGFSSLYFVFIVLAGYVLVNRGEMFDRIWMHPVFLPGYAFIGITFVLELTSPFPLYESPLRFGLMIAGAILVASLCRDRLALQACVFGCLGAALWLAVVLFLTSFGALHSAATTDFREASKVRAEVFSNKAVGGNINHMSFTCVQGGVAAFALTLADNSPFRRKLFGAIAVFCLSGSFLTMSRATIAVTSLSCAAILYVCGFKRGKTFLVAGVLGATILLILPNAIWSRMAFQTEQGNREARAWLYVTAVEQLPEYVIAGVGAGNFGKQWGWEHGFGGGDVVYSLHNMFLQVMVFWGLLGLIPFVALMWQAYRYFPKGCGRDVLSLSLLGIAVSQLAMMPFYSDIYSKGLSLALGMIVGSCCWIWPRGIVQPIEPSFRQVAHSHLS